ncbi:MAG TPA: hypothetical protein VN848_10205 [Gemmatimonadales bacterium]|nr:hypothetical protein [Gemmatimonadales bacterium]
MFNAVLLLASLTVVFGLGEVAVRLLAPQQLVIKRPDVWKAVDTLGWVHQPNVRTTINTGERTVQVVTDSDGFRVSRAGRTPAKRHILLLGDSFMEALQVEYEQSVAGLLEARLPERLGKPVSVVNTGVGGWNPPQFLLQARALLGRRPFDLIIVSLYLGHDVVAKRLDRLPPRPLAEVHSLRLPTSLAPGELVDALLYPINDYLVVRSQLFVFLKTRFRTALMRFHLTAVYFPPVLFRREAISPRWNVTADICSDIATLGERAGVPTLFVLVPSPYEVDHSALVQVLHGFGVDSSELDVDQPTRLMREALERRHLRVANPLLTMRAAESQGTQLYGAVDNHFTPAGHDVLEHYIEPEVVTLLERPRDGAALAPR